MWSFLKKLRNGTAVVSTPLTPEEAREIQGFGYRREWRCGCGARLAIRSRAPHEDHVGPNIEIKQDGHATLQPHQMTWAGLVKERGWNTDPVECPACKLGLSVPHYKDLRRSGLLP